MNNKLIHLLSKLSKKEFESFALFAKTPVFNTQKSLYTLILSLKPFYPDFTISEHQSEKIYQSIFQSNEFNKNHFKQLQTEVYKLLLQFIGHLELIKSPEQTNTNILRFLKNHSTKLYRKESNQLQFSGEANNSTENLIVFQQQDINNSYLVETIRKQGRKLDVKSDKAINSLSNFFTISYLRYACQEANLKNINKSNTEVLLTEDILKWIDNGLFSSREVPEMYFFAYKMLNSQNERYFERLKSLLTSHANLLEKADAHELYIYAQNYCIRKINSGDNLYLGELLQLYKATLEQNIIIDNNQLSPWDYKNIVFVGLKFEAFDWTIYFINHYKSYLPDLEKENAYRYNLARFHFAKKEYNQVISLLNQVEYSDVFYQLDAKSTLLKTYFELDEADAMFSLMDSFKILILRSNKISKQYKLLYNNLIRFTKNIYNLRVGDKERVRKLLLKINDSACADKQWVIQKANEML